MLFLMDDRPTTMERAYQLAKSGECVGVANIIDRLRAEGYTDAPAQIFGPTLTADLRRLCVKARGAPDA